MNHIKVLLTLILISYVPSSVLYASDNFGAIQVIVNANSDVTSMTKKHVMAVFLGRSRTFPNGKPAKALDNKMGSSIREYFFETLTGKSISDIDAYWARLRYSGRASPPKEIDSVDEILAEVGQNVSAMAYVSGQDLEVLSKQGIVVVYTLEAN